MEVVLGTKIKGLNMLNQLGWLIWSYKSVDAKLICKHKGLIPDSNVKACQPI